MTCWFYHKHMRCRWFSVCFFASILLLFRGCEETILFKSKTDSEDKEDVDENAGALLITSAEIGDALAVREYLDQGADVNHRNNSGHTPLMRAARYNSQLNVVDMLLEAGADVSLADSEGYSALMFAAFYNDNPEITERLLKHIDELDVDREKRIGIINLRNENSNTALMLAIRSGRTTRVRTVGAILSAGAYVNIRYNDGATALIYEASHESALEVVQLLLSADASVDLKDNQGATALMYAVEHTKHPEVVEALVDAGADVNERDGSQRTALDKACDRQDSNERTAILLVLQNSDARKFNGGTICGTSSIDAFLSAAEHGDLSELRDQIEVGIDVNQTNAEGQTALMLAARFNNNAEIIQALLEAEASISTQDEEGNTALMYAAQYNSHTEVTEALLTTASEVNMTNKEELSALMLAARYNKNERVIRALTDAGADVMQVNKSGATSLMLAVEYNIRLEVVHVLLEANSDVTAQDQDAETVLMKASARNNLTFIEAILSAINALDLTPEEKTAVINATSTAGTTALDQACISSNTDVRSTLKEAGATKSNGGTACGTPFEDIFLTAARREDFSGLDQQIKKGVDVNAINQYGHTALMLSARHNTRSTALVATLIEHGAEIHIKDVNGYTALMWAAHQNNNREIVGALLEAGARVSDQDNNGQSPILLSAHYNSNPDITEQLLEAGADINTRDNSRYTSLMWAASSNSNLVVEVLLNAGAEIDAQDNNGNTALMLAVKESTQISVINALIRAGANVNIVDRQRFSILDHACRRLSSSIKDSIIRVLVDAGATTGQGASSCN